MEQIIALTFLPILTYKLVFLITKEAVIKGSLFCYLDISYPTKFDPNRTRDMNKLVKDAEEVLGASATI